MSFLLQTPLFGQQPYVQEEGPGIPATKANVAFFPSDDFNVSGQLSYVAVPDENKDVYELGLAVPWNGITTRQGRAYNNHPANPPNVEQGGVPVTLQDAIGDVIVVPKTRDQLIPGLLEMRKRAMFDENPLYRPGAWNNWAQPADWVGNEYQKSSFASGESLQLRTPFQHNYDRYIHHGDSRVNMHQSSIPGARNARPKGGHAVAPLAPVWTRIKDPAYDVGPIQGWNSRRPANIPAYPLVPNQQYQHRTDPYI